MDVVDIYPEDKVELNGTIPAMVQEKYPELYQRKYHKYLGQQGIVVKVGQALPGANGNSRMVIVIWPDDRRFIYNYKRLRVVKSADVFENTWS